MNLNRELKYVKKMWKRAQNEKHKNKEEDENEEDSNPLDITSNTEVMIKLVNLEKENEE